MPSVRSQLTEYYEGSDPNLFTELTGELLNKNPRLLANAIDMLFGSDELQTSTINNLSDDITILKDVANKLLIKINLLEAANEELRLAVLELSKGIKPAPTAGTLPPSPTNPTPGSITTQINKIDPPDHIGVPSMEHLIIPTT